MSDDYNRAGQATGAAADASDRGASRITCVATDATGGQAASAIRRPRGGTGNGWLWPLAIGVVVFIAIHPYDLPVFEAMSLLGERLKGDVRREWFAWQQYGQGAAIVISAVLIWLLDPARRRRLLDLLLAVGLAQLASSGGKMLVGRPRPRPEFMDPQSFPGPWGLYPIMRDGQWRLVHAWDRGAGANADLWSMPSSHTLFACMFSVFMATLYPRARWVFAGLAVMVGVARVVFGAHWPTDVVVGAAVGYAIGAVVTRRGLGVRLLDWVWIRLVDRKAEPAWPRMLRTEK